VTLDEPKLAIDIVVPLYNEDQVVTSSTADCWTFRRAPAARSGKPVERLTKRIEEGFRGFLTGSNSSYD
jgi:hypothetical protein